VRSTHRPSLLLFLVGSLDGLFRGVEDACQVRGISGFWNLRYPFVAYRRHLHLPTFKASFTSDVVSVTAVTSDLIAHHPSLTDYLGPENRNRSGSPLLAEERNRFLATIADSIFVAHAAPGSRTLALCQQLAEQEKWLLTIEDRYRLLAVRCSLDRSASLLSQKYVT
jgi:hypothetical protein